MKPKKTTLLAAAALALVGCSSPPKTWAPRREPACTLGSSTPELNQQRAFLASLLALEERGYTVLHMEWPLQLEAHFISNHRPDTYQTRWVVDVAPGGELSIRAPQGWDEPHDKTENWYQRLRKTITQYHCRELEWLRWQAENKGLLPIGMGMEAVPGAGGESPPEEVTQ